MPARDGADVVVGRARTTEAAATGRTGWPVARETEATGGPNAPERATVACGPVSGCVEGITPAVRWAGPARGVMGRGKCCSGPPPHGGCRYPKTTPRGP